MSKFIVTESVPAIKTWVYSVEAESEEQAIEMVMNGKAEIIDSLDEKIDYDNAEFEVIHDSDED